MISITFSISFLMFKVMMLSSNHSVIGSHGQFRASRPRVIATRSSLSSSKARVLPQSLIRLRFKKSVPQRRISKDLLNESPEPRAHVFQKQLTVVCQIIFKVY